MGFDGKIMDCVPPMNQLCAAQSLCFSPRVYRSWAMKWRTSALSRLFALCLRAREWLSLCYDEDWMQRHWNSWVLLRMTESEVRCSMRRWRADVSVLLPQMRRFVKFNDVISGYECRLRGGPGTWAISISGDSICLSSDGLFAVEFLILFKAP